MRLPKEYDKNLKAGIITLPMYIAALYSVNKRAKNYRDKMRELKRGPIFMYWEAAFDKASAEMDKYYALKESLLSFISPDCIHREFKGYQRTRIYSYEAAYKHIKDEDIVWSNSYYDYEKAREVFFVDIENKSAPVYFYYLYYDLGERSFHTPLAESDIEHFPELKIEDIDELLTEGKDINDLVSVTFVNKVLEFLKKGEKIKGLPEGKQKENLNEHLCS